MKRITGWASISQEHKPEDGYEFDGFDELNGSSSARGLIRRIRQIRSIRIPALVLPCFAALRERNSRLRIDFGLHETLIQLTSDIQSQDIVA
jgi:hypothetical protein